MEWAATEMQTANLGDERLNKRLVSLLDALGNDPQSSIPVACGGWTETKAAKHYTSYPRTKHMNLPNGVSPT
jgi:hypothetical protein